MQQPMALLGFVPLIPYMMCLYIAYRMPHVHSGAFPVWIIGWTSFGLFTILFAIARVRVVLDELSGRIPFDGYRLAFILTGSCCLLIFVLAQRWSFKNGEQALRDNLRADIKRLASLFGYRGRSVIRKNHEP